MTPAASPAVFLGPTLPRAEAEAILAARYLPPARAGDILSIVESRSPPSSIVLIDGCPTGRPVMHKELLFALELGIPVLGASDVGALRAAETMRWGMIGHGEIFRLYKDGLILDDDEIACAWSEEEEAFVRHSEPMVNVRATVSRAVSEKMLTPAEGQVLEGCGKAIFYRDRNWARILAAAKDGPLSPARLEEFEAWLATGYVDLKKQDAVGLLERVAAEGAGRPEPVRAERSPYFLAQRERERSMARRTGSVSLDSIRIHAALHMPDYEDRAFAALNRQIVLMVAEAFAVEPTDAEMDTERKLFLDRHGLRDQSDLAGWAEINDLRDEDAEALIRDDARCRKLHKWLQTIRSPRLTTRPVIDWLRRSGLYPAWADRAATGEAAAPPPGLRFAADETRALWAEHLRAIGARSSLPLEAWAAVRGLTDPIELTLELARAKAVRAESGEGGTLG